MLKDISSDDSQQSTAKDDRSTLILEKNECYGVAERKKGSQDNGVLLEKNECYGVVEKKHGSQDDGTLLEKYECYGEMEKKQGSQDDGMLLEKNECYGVVEKKQDNGLMLEKNECYAIVEKKQECLTTRDGDQSTTHSDSKLMLHKKHYYDKVEDEFKVREGDQPLSEDGNILSLRNTEQMVGKRTHISSAPMGWRFMCVLCTVINGITITITIGMCILLFVGYTRISELNSKLDSLQEENDTNDYDLRLTQLNSELNSIKNEATSNYSSLGRELTQLSNSTTDVLSSFGQELSQLSNSTSKALSIALGKCSILHHHVLLS